MNVSETIFKEADILWKAFSTGVILIFVYDLFRIVRKLVKHKSWCISVEDFLFWLSSAIIIFAMLYRENDGNLRAFSIGGVVLGMICYTLLFSRWIVRFSVFVLEKILYPLRKIGRFLKKRLKKS